MEIVIKDKPFSWALLNKVRGRALKVETEHLFCDQFNTVPIRRVSESGLRVMEEDVEKVIDDMRIGRSRCHWCGNHFRSGVMWCPHCGKHEYIKPLIRKPSTGRVA